MSTSLEKHFRLYDDYSEGVFLSIGLSPDSSNSIVIQTTDMDARDFYGDVHLTFTKQEAKLLAKALLELAGD